MISRKHPFLRNVDIFENMGKSDFSRDLKITSFSRNVDIFDILAKNNFFKESNFSRNWYFRRYRQKTIFSKWSQENILFLEMLIFSKIWAKTIYLKWSQENILFFEMLIFSKIWARTIFQSDLKITSFSRNVDIFLHIAKKQFFQRKLFFSNIDIFENMGKKRFFQNDLKKTSFSSKFWFFRTYGQKRFI